MQTTYSQRMGAQVALFYTIPEHYMLCSAFCTAQCTTTSTVIHKVVCNAEKQLCSGTDKT